MNRRLMWVLLLFAICSVPSFGQQSDAVVTDPTGDQTIVEPDGNTLIVDNPEGGVQPIPGPGGHVAAGTFTGQFNLPDGNAITFVPSLLLTANPTLPIGIVRLSPAIQMNQLTTKMLLPNLRLSLSSLSIDASQDPANLDLYPGDGHALNVWDNGSVPFCMSTVNDFVGVQTVNGMSNAVCGPYDIFDVSNRETFGNGYMHWFANGADPSSWNAGISNATPGILSFDDGSGDGDGLGTIQSGNIVLTPNSGGSITFQDATVQATAWNGTTLGGDYAESVDIVSSTEKYEPGDVLVIDPKHPGEFLHSSSSFSRLVAGVYSTKPGLVGRRQTGEHKPSAEAVPMAMMGIVPTKATAENGPIQVGDLLVSSSQSGRVMRGGDGIIPTGTVVGKAMSELDAGNGTIEVLITLQ